MYQLVAICLLPCTIQGLQFKKWVNVLEVRRNHHQL
jgi:hypothetical protein